MNRYVDADRLCEGLKDMAQYQEPYKRNTILGVVSTIENFPTADVVEVVRCRECIHWGGATYGFVCRKFSGIETKICMGADHYCSYGERREKMRDRLIELFS